MAQVFLLPLLTLCLVIGVPRAAAEAPDPAQVDFFENRVRPVLAESCFECHNGETQKAGLRLDSRAAMIAGGEGGPVLVAGDPEASKFIQAIRYTGKINMPPKEKLSEEAIQVLTDWVTMGAPWPGSEDAGPLIDPKQAWADRVAEVRSTHWAFQPVKNPPLPEVQQADWARNEIDHFVLARQEAAGLQPNGPASKASLIRRIHYDLTGLPPTQEAVAAFEADERPEAVEALVEELLASPHYGERWARYWMDLARYSDTKGYVFQQERDFAFSHTYRDFLIHSFNEDVPYDQFLRYQLAADKMDLGEEKWPLAGMGYLTLGRRFIGNVHDITDDRIDVVTRGMMAMTVQCARCHDHKYDPISAADYYAMYGIFRSSDEPGELPLIETPDESDPEYQAFLAEVAQKQEDHDRLLDELHVALLAESRREIAPYLRAAGKAWDLDIDNLKLVAKDESVRWQLVQQWRDFIKGRVAQHDPVFAPWQVLRAVPEAEWAIQAPAALAALLANTAEQPLNSLISKALEGFQPATFDEVTAKYGEVLNRVNTTWTEILASYSQIDVKDPASTRTPPENLSDPDMETVRLLLYGADSPANLGRGDVWNLSDVPTQNRIRDRQNAIARVQNTHPGRPDRAMILTDTGTPFDPYVFLRGKPDSRGPSVMRRNLEILGGSDEAPFTDGSGRMDLANAIVSRDNPLTARVLVNRVWMHHFGEPLVDSPSDFGLRSDPPSHPELLDWLAWDFMEHGWSMKHLHRRILHSATYLQSSADRPEASAVDSENELLWRQNRRRLDFESMRDSILAAAGTLNRAMGGPSVDILGEPMTTRRTVYSRIDRQNLPGIFRTFDLASPDAHSPARFETTVPQQALFLMNSPFMNEQARVLGQSVLDLAEYDLPAAVHALYERALQRPPGEDEIEMAYAFLAQQSMNTALDASLNEDRIPQWQYGYGQVDTATGMTVNFAPFVQFKNDTYSTGADFPHDAGGWASLTRTGGHPGLADFAVVRRWISPVNGTIGIRGDVEHGSGNGDGILAYMISSRSGIVWEGHVFNSKAATDADGISVERGDTLDLVVACGGNPSYDGFRWHPRIYVEQLHGTNEGNVRTEWFSRRDFSGPPAPPPAPLEPMAKLAQVVLMTNEFMFVD